jgi:hypothetical protein
MHTEENHKCFDLDELLKTTELHIQQFGLQVMLVGSTAYSPSFAYSIGLWKKYKHPELICFGLPNDLAHPILNDVAEMIKNGEIMETGKSYLDIFKHSRAAFLIVDPENIGDYFGLAIKYYHSSDFPALQLIWTDRNDKFPWEEGFEEVFLYKQPLLDRNADFKFRESRDLATFTTRQWLENQMPILRVVHDNDGDWQFLTGDQMPDDIRIVALEQLVLKDKTLNRVFDLEYGESAEREFIGGPWTRNKFKNDEEDG